MVLPEFRKAGSTHEEQAANIRALFHNSGVTQVRAGEQLPQIDNVNCDQKNEIPSK